MNKLEIKIENTNDTETRRFLLNLPISTEVVQYEDSNKARRSKLANKIFGFPWTQKVTVGRDYVDVQKQDWVEWDILAQPLAGLIEEHLVAAIEENPNKKIEENPKLEGFKPTQAATPQSDFKDPLEIRVHEILLSKVNPGVAMHGGKITLIGVRDFKAYVRMEGGCQGCSASKTTLKLGVENMIKKEIPEILEILDVTDHSLGENPFFRS